VFRQWKTFENKNRDFEQVALFLCEKFSVSAFFTPGTGNGWGRKQVLGLGVLKSVNDYEGNHLQKLGQLVDKNNDWIMGHLGYDLKEETEQVYSVKPNEDGFNDLFFFIPEIVVLHNENGLLIGGMSEEKIDGIATLIDNYTAATALSSPVSLQERTSQSEYFSNSEALLRHIQRGDIYEINYCVDFRGNSSSLEPASVFRALQKISDAPFATLYRNENSWLMCASPERYMAKNGNRLFSQPMKGTRRRGNTAAEDEVLIHELQNDAKERMENVMIVDLVRNDLSRVAQKGTVHVSELFGVHSFRTVHQMISTVECEVREGVSFAEIVGATFPMGSMTGAPKIRAMQLAEKYEDQSRGIYSGSVGYITPEKDFDFNVVIRSITWNSQTGNVSAKAGSALTSTAIPALEHEECMIKIQAMMNALKRV